MNFTSQELHFNLIFICIKYYKIDDFNFIKNLSHKFVAFKNKKLIIFIKIAHIKIVIRYLTEFTSFHSPFSLHTSVPPSQKIQIPSNSNESFIKPVRLEANPEKTAELG
jgi:hypothetical protein